MRIGYIYPFEANPPKGGNRLHAFQLIHGFLSEGHEVVTLGDSSIDGVQSMPRNREGARALLGAIDVLYVRVDANHLRQNPLVVDLMENAQVPIVWEINAPSNENLAFSWLGGRGAPRGWLSRWTDHLRRTAHAARQRPAMAREEALRRRLATHVAAATCVSEPVARYARESLGMTDVTVLANGSDPDINHPGLEPMPLPERFQGRLKALFAGSPIYPWQGLDVLLEAAAAGDDSVAYLLLVNQPLNRSTPDNVLVLEAVPYAEVGRYICSADVCLALQPDFTWSPWGFHGSPMKLFDYMACGRPIVTTGVGQLGDVVRMHDNGLICEPSADDLLEKLRYLAAHPEEAHRMGANSRQAVLDRYNWAHITNETLSVLERALHPAPSTPRA